VTHKEVILLKITPLEIKKQRFKSKVRGYDPAEVETFLEMVADEYESVLNEKTRFGEELTKLKTQLRSYQEVEKTLQDTLMNAQESVSQSRENSKREAKIIIREAELKAERVLDEAREKLDKMKNELAILRAQKASFAKRLKHLIESQVELIDVLGREDLKAEEKDVSSRVQGLEDQSSSATKRHTIPTEKKP
jgi:cell division initiation protein